MNFEQEIDNWLKEVANQCDKYAREIDLDFYVFQTPVIFNPQLLIIGINPGNNISYSKMLEIKGYDKRPYNDLGYDINLLTEKPSWETGKGSDVIRERLKRILIKIIH